MNKFNDVLSTATALALRRSDQRRDARTFEATKHERRLTMRMTTSILFSGLILAVATGTGSIALAGGKDYKPHIDPADFQETVDNPYMPLVPGTIAKFVEKNGDETSEIEVTVMHDTKMVMGVKCTVVHDKMTEKGVLKEDTYDWYAQRKDGTVWYFGEDTKEFKSGGRVSTKGSWEAGINGCQPGIMMPAHPKPGEPYRQEYGRDVAEDMGQVVATDETVAVPAGTYKDCVKTKDWSMLEAGHEFKWYAKGVGVVKETATAGDVATLISITHE